jgi:ribosomal protein L11 methyltransferase
VTVHKISLDLSDRSAALQLAGAMQELIEPAPDVLTVFEQARAGSPGVGWRIEAYYASPPDLDRLHSMLCGVSRAPLAPLRALPVPDRNWVALSQAALPPVRAGRFTVHGSHDRERVARGPNAILIDAGEAFGTAHHPTTLGCLVEIDRLTRRRAFASVLDLGCGSGLLAIAAARALPRAHIMGVDIDPTSVGVARANGRANGAGRRVAFVEGAGLAVPAIRRARPFDLVVANILAGPLVSLAPEIRRAAAPGAVLVLSGLLTGEARAVAAGYRAQGFALLAHRRIEGWSTLTLARRT